MTKRSFGPLVLALILFFATILAIELVSRFVLERVYFKPGVVQTVGSAQSPTSFEGIILQEKALNQPDILPVYGSSEFSAASEFHPWPFFDGKPSGFTTFLIGQGGSQDLVHSLHLAAQDDNLKGKKVAVILSAQWFTQQGIDKNYLAQNFSPLQMYRILNSDSLSIDIKKQIVNRLLEFPEVFNRYPILYKNLQYFGDQHWSHIPRKVVYQAEGWIEMKGLGVRDIIKTVLLTSVFTEDIVKQNAKNTSALANSLTESPFDWDQLKEKAHKQGEEHSTNNSFGIMDSYYTTYILPELGKYKGAKKDERLYPSPEYKDLEILMKVLKENQAEALFIIVPVNGAWYDYTGFPIEERNGYYERVGAMVKENGFQLADFSGHEYDKYFLQDIMHLGWKGWVYVNEALDKFYHEGY